MIGGGRNQARSNGIHQDVRNHVSSIFIVAQHSLEIAALPQRMTRDTLPVVTSELLACFTKALSGQAARDPSTSTCTWSGITQYATTANARSSAARRICAHTMPTNSGFVKSDRRSNVQNVNEYRYGPTYSKSGLRRKRVACMSAHRQTTRHPTHKDTVGPTFRSGVFESATTFPDLQVGRVRIGNHLPNLQVGRVGTSKA
jgi:hypothetical protein